MYNLTIHDLLASMIWPVDKIYIGSGFPDEWQTYYTYDGFEWESIPQELLKKDLSTWVIRCKTEMISACEIKLIYECYIEL